MGLWGSHRPTAPCLWLLLCTAWALLPSGGGETQLVGAGSILTSQLYTDAFFAYRFTQPDVQLSYRATSSPDGLCRLEGSPTSCSGSLIGDPGGVDFAGTETVLSAEDYLQYPDLQLYPTVASAVVPIYNLGGRCANLTLSPALLADIYDGTVRDWDHPAIQTFNPFCQLPNASIRLLVRADSSGISDIFFKSLASFSRGHTDDAGNSSSLPWAPSSAATRVVSHQALLSYVMVHPGALGYAALDPALQNQVSIAQFQRGDAIIRATSESIAYALLELGLNFGNNGDDPAHLTADIFGAESDLSWPIATLAYVALHTQSQRAGTTCDAVAELKAFWRWFWTSSSVESIVTSRGASRLPRVLRIVVMARFMNDIVCDEQEVIPQDGLPVSGAGPASISDLFQKLMPIYHLRHPRVSLAFTVLADDAADLSAELAQHQFLAVPSALPPNVENVATFIFAGIGRVVISNFQLVLDGPTLAHILDGTIQTWLHPTLQALNPNGLRAADGTVLEEDDAIVLFGSSSCTSASWDLVMQRYVESYTGNAIHGASAPATEELVQAAVAGSPFALSIVTLTSYVMPHLQLATFRRPDGFDVVPSWVSIKACASHDVFHQGGRRRSLQDSLNPACYPLSEVVYLLAPSVTCDGSHGSERSETAAFIAWLYGNPVLDVVQADFSLAPLTAASSTVTALNDQALQSISCSLEDEDAHQLFLFLSITIPIVGVAVTMGLAGVALLRKAAAQLHALQDRYPDDHVAQHCLEAISGFRLEALEWLEFVPHPTPLQLAFLRLLRLLQEVQAYIPDHLLRAVQEGRSPSLWLGSSAQAAKQSGRSPTDALLSPDGHVSDDPRSLAAVSHARPDSGSLAADFRPCTYLCVKFGLTDLTTKPEAQQLHDLGQVAAHIVTIGKAARASVDRVTINTVALYWGLSGGGASALQAVKAALEMVQLQAAIAEELGQCSLQLQVGIGQGPSATATVRTAEHPFVVISGKEVTRAVDVVMMDLPLQCQCRILVTEEVHQKVHHWVECFPRLLLRGGLLWEPVRVFRGEAEDGPRLHESARLQGRTKGVLSGKVMEVPFLMAAQGASQEEVRSEVESLKLRHAGALSVQDVHCLDALVASTGPASAAAPSESEF